MQIMRLTNQGLSRFADFIISLKGDHPEEFPTSLFEEGEFATPIGGDTASLDALNLDDRMQTASYLYELIEQLDINNPERDAGFWSWCSAYLFERLRKGKRKVGETAVWVLMPEKHDRYYRHYLASIWGVYSHYSEHPQILEPLFVGRQVNTPGDLFEQFASRQQRITNVAALEVVHMLYWDANKKKLKSGAAGKSGGSARRLAQVLKQFARTYDLHALEGTQLYEMLPIEFDRFRT